MVLDILPVAANFSMLLNSSSSAFTFSNSFIFCSSCFLNFSAFVSAAFLALFSLLKIVMVYNTNIIAIAKAATLITLIKLEKFAPRFDLFTIRSSSSLCNFTASILILSIVIFPVRPKSFMVSVIVRSWLLKMFNPVDRIVSLVFIKPCKVSSLFFCLSLSCVSNLSFKNVESISGGAL